MKIVEGYLQLTPRLAPGAATALTKAATDAGRKAGQAVTDSVKNTQPQAERAGKSVGSSAGDATVKGYRDSTGRLRGEGGKFITEGKPATDRKAEDAGRSAGNRFGVGMRTTLGPLRLFGGAVIGGIIAQIGEKAAMMGIQTVSAVQQARVAFTTLTGSAKEANQEIIDLQKFAANTPFEFVGLVHDANLLQGVGVQAKSIIPIMTAWGDAAGALGVDNDHFNQIMIALSQSLAAGKINAQDMNQIVQGGIPIWKIMGEAMGKTVSQVRDMSQSGTLLSSDVLPKVQAQMEKDYGGSMVKQSQTLQGVWSNLMDSLDQGLANSLMPIVPTLTTLIPRATTMFSSALKGVSSAFSGFMSGLKGAGGDLHGVAKVFWEIAQGVLSFYYSIKTGKADVSDIMGVIGGLGAIIHNLMVWTLAAAHNAWPVFKVAVGLAYVVLKQLITVLVPLTAFLAKHAGTIQLIAVVVLGLVAAYRIYQTAMLAGRAIQVAWTAALVAYNIVMNVVKGSTTAWATVQWILNAAMDANPIGLIILGIAALVIGIIAVIHWHKQLAAFFVAVWHGFLGIVKVVWNWIKDHWPLLLEILGGPIGIAVGLIVGHIKQIKAGAAAVGAWFAGPFVGFFVNLGKDIAAPFLWLWHKVIDPVWQAFSKAVTTAIGIVRNVIGALDRFFHPVFVGMGIAVKIYAKLMEVAFGVIRLAIAFVVKSIQNWVHAFQEAWGFIKAGAAAAWQWVYNTLIAPWLRGFAMAGQWVRDMYDKHVHPIFIAIVTTAKAAWNGLWASFIGPTINGVKAVGAWFVMLWTNYVMPAWNNIKQGASVTWAWLRGVFNSIVGAVKAVGGWFVALWTNYVAPAWNTLKTGLAAGWNWVKTNVFDRIVNIVTKDIPSAFDKGVGFVKSAWDKIKSAAKEPIKFIIDTVINGGIIKGFNWIAGKVSPKDKIDPLKISGFAKGGYTGSGGKYDVADGPVHKGEFVIPRSEVSKHGVDKLNRTFLGGHKGGDGSHGVSIGYADGGLVGWLKGAWNTLSDPAGALKGKINDMLKGVPGLGAFTNLAKGTVGRLMTDLGQWLGTKVTGSAAGSDYKGPITPNIKAAQQFVMSQNHKPYVWAGAGPGGADCSGFVSEVYNILSGKSSPWGHTFSTSNEAGFFPLGGHGAFTAGWANPGERGGGDVGHTAGNLAGLAFESGGAGGDMHYGKGSTSVDSFAHVGHMRGFSDGGMVGVFDNGGLLPPGGLAVNRSRKPEMVRSSKQEDGLADLLKAILAELRGSGIKSELHFHDKADVKTYVQALAMQKGLSS